MSGGEEGGGEPSSGKTPDKKSSAGVNRRSRLGSFRPPLTSSAEALIHLTQTILHQALKKIKRIISSERRYVLTPFDERPLPLQHLVRFPNIQAMLAHFFLD